VNIKQLFFIVKRALLVIAAILTLIILYVKVGIPYFEDKKIHDLEIKSQYMIKQVELYKNLHHKLPQNEDDMKLNLPDDYPIYYGITQDSTTYMVGFPIGWFHSMAYYSDTKKWIRQN